MEFDLIARIRDRAPSRDDVVLGIGDDAALLQVPPDRQLVVAMDTLNAGVHFPPNTAPADIGWKALAVNLSDLAAMGAEAAWCTLSLSLPSGEAAFVDGVLDGFLGLAARHRVALVGGDTTRGPLSVCVTVRRWKSGLRAPAAAGAPPAAVPASSARIGMRPMACTRATAAELLAASSTPSCTSPALETALYLKNGIVSRINPRA